MWKDFDKIILSELVDDQDYLLRHRNANGKWSSAYLGWWDSEEGRFLLLDCLRDYKIEVDQVMEIPDE